ncbi:MULTISPECIES: carbonic anhydrase [unclassified Sphingomonas]|jgi:carbonic anhydrase|uniref:carbonic anhydrase n=1 Tax=unclassified Sphingomonas TaxID=196159 RepID=UPI000E105F2F|nr:MULTISPECIES: carbonic anhydrase [unclassified Sphingomonas]AXJ95614.1 carbonic anhydrase [Sphingomonas sp. FARSPH]
MNNEVIGRVLAFEKKVFQDQHALYSTLARHGQSPKALIISCSDSRIVPEHIMQAQPGDLFVCRNAGNIVPPFAQPSGGTTATVEYAISVLGVRDIIVCGHSDCGAMKGLSGDPAALSSVPNVAQWLRHGAAARQVVDRSYPELTDGERVRALSLENVVAQIANLRTHPSVAAGIARGEISLHGWFVDIHEGNVLGLDGNTGKFVVIREGDAFPVALPAAERRASDVDFAMAAE